MLTVQSPPVRLAGSIRSQQAGAALRPCPHHYRSRSVCDVRSEFRPGDRNHPPPPLSHQLSSRASAAATVAAPASGPARGPWRGYRARGRVRATRGRDFRKPRPTLKLLLSLNHSVSVLGLGREGEAFAHSLAYIGWCRRNSVAAIFSPEVNAKKSRPSRPTSETLIYQCF